MTRGDEAAAKLATAPLGHAVVSAFGSGSPEAIRDLGELTLDRLEALAGVGTPGGIEPAHLGAEEEHDPCADREGWMSSRQRQRVRVQLEPIRIE
jgi:hypothetical protein